MLGTEAVADTTVGLAAKLPPKTNLQPNPIPKREKNYLLFYESLDFRFIG